MGNSSSGGTQSAARERKDDFMGNDSDDTDRGLPQEVESNKLMMDQSLLAVMIHRADSRIKQRQFRALASDEKLQSLLRAPVPESPLPPERKDSIKSENNSLLMSEVKFVEPTTSRFDTGPKPESPTENESADEVSKTIVVESIPAPPVEEPKRRVIVIPPPVRVAHREFDFSQHHQQVPLRERLALKKQEDDRQRRQAQEEQARLGQLELSKRTDSREPPSEKPKEEKGEEELVRKDVDENVGGNEESESDAQILAETAAEASSAIAEAAVSDEFHKKDKSKKKQKKDKDKQKEDKERQREDKEKDKDKDSTKAKEDNKDEKKEKKENDKEKGEEKKKDKEKKKKEEENGSAKTKLHILVPAMTISPAQSDRYDRIVSESKERVWALFNEELGHLSQIEGILMKTDNAIKALPRLSNPVLACEQEWITLEKCIKLYRFVQNDEARRRACSDRLTSYVACIRPQERLY